MKENALFKSKPLEVPKAWGKEEWIHNAGYCGKRMVIQKGWASSMHMHRMKDETFYVDSGMIYLEGVEDSPFENVVLVGGDVFHLPPLTYHRFTALATSVFFEFSTHHDDEDVVRRDQSHVVTKDRLDVLISSLRSTGMIS